MMLLSKLAPQSLREFGQCSEDHDVALSQKFSNSFGSLIQSLIHHDVSHEEVTKTKTITICGGKSSFIVVSMPLKSAWSSSKGEVTRIACIGSFTWAPSCWIHLSQPVISFCICTAMLGHQNQSCNRDRVPLLALMSCIPMAPVHGHHSMSHGDYKLQHFFQLSGWSTAVIEDTLMKYKYLPLPQNGHALSLHGGVSQ